MYFLEHLAKTIKKNDNANYVYNFNVDSLI